VPALAKARFGDGEMSKVGTKCVDCGFNLEDFGMFYV
jgi:hypothetical protein